MPLPTFDLPRDTVELPNGATVAVRGLTRGEALTIGDLDGDIKAIEIALIAYGTDTPRDDVAAWYETAQAGMVDLIVNRVTELSGMGKDATRPTNAG